MTIYIENSKLFDSVEIYRLDGIYNTGQNAVISNLFYVLRAPIPFQFDGTDLRCDGMRVQSNGVNSMTVSYVISPIDVTELPWTAVGPPVSEKYLQEIFQLLREEEAKGIKGYLKGYILTQTPIFRDCRETSVTTEGPYRYYSTQRPADIGTFPRFDNEPVSIENYDSRQPVEGGAFRAWAVLTYTKPLTQKQMDEYELRAAPGK